jgi:hypothetical protein
MSEPLGFDEGDHEIGHRGHPEEGCGELEHDHSLPTPRATRATTPKTARIATM